MGQHMKKSELLRLLSQYEDDEEILVESVDGGFDSPAIYITAVRARLGGECRTTSSSPYVNDNAGTGFGAVILRTATGFTRLR